MRRNADTGVSRSATSSLTTGTKVLRCASSVNVSNDVCFIDDRQRCLFHQSCWWPPANPPLGLVFGLRDEHVEPAERLAARRGRLFQQPRFHRVVNEVVDDAAVERALEWRLVDIRKHADRSRVHQQVPALRCHRERRRSSAGERRNVLRLAAISAVHGHDAAGRRERHRDRARRTAGAKNRRTRAAQIEAASRAAREIR